jgi:hypothetical protein
VEEGEVGERCHRCGPEHERQTHWQLQPEVDPNSLVFIVVRPRAPCDLLPSHENESKSASVGESSVMMMPFFFVLAETKIINKITLLTRSHHGIVVGQRHSLSTCEADGAPVLLEEDAATVTKLLLQSRESAVY